MELNGTYTFAAPPELVWDAIMDPEVLANILPGCESLEKVSDREYAGVLNVRVGPVQGKFSGAVLLSEMNHPESFHMDIDGKGAAGFVKGGGDAKLTFVDGQTLLDYSGEAQVGGRIASVGQRLLDTSARSIVRQGLESLDRIIQTRLAPAPAPEPAPGEAPPPSTPPALTPPSEWDVALGVVKDIFEEFVPEEKRPLVLGALGALAVLILVWLLKAIFGRDD
ncbi:MAG: carbon monoxide dehydrogenase subunit G [Caldilineales bacterium]|nr:carbon monoxide dehydrogenase subunit G [Caldilineales bacterium]